MDKSLIDSYTQRMLEMFRTRNATVPVVTNNTTPIATNNTTPQAEQPTEANGELVAIVTTVRGLYPVPNAKVTVFTGNIDDMQVIDMATTDQSGKTRAFSLKTPQKSLSLSSGQTATPYANYNMLVEADGFVRNIHLNIPVFSGVTSLQTSDLLLFETAGEDKSGQVFDEAQEYTL